MLGSPESRKPGAGSRLHDQIRDFRLLDFQIRLRLQHLAHLQAIGLLVALGARRPYGGAARGIQQAELDADGVGDFAHDAAERVDFAHQVSLGDAAHGGVARHLRDQVDVERVEGGLQAHARRSHRGLASGMAGADDNDVEMFGELHCKSSGSEPQKILASGSSFILATWRQCDFHHLLLLPFRPYSGLSETSQGAS